MDNDKIYVIPGWGFYSSLFQYSELASLGFIGLDYLDQTNITIDSIAESLSVKIKDAAIIIGWSLGGLIAIKLAHLYPNIVKKIILLSSQPKFSGNSDWSGVEPLLIDKFTNNAKLNLSQTKQYFIKLVNYPNLQLENKKLLNNHLADTQEEILLQLLDMMFTIDLRHEYSTLKCDILHMIANKDAIIIQNPNQLKQLNPNTNIISFDNIGHAGFLSHGEIYKNSIEEFIT